MDLETDIGLFEIVLIVGIVGVIGYFLYKLLGSSFTSIKAALSSVAGATQYAPGNTPAQNAQVDAVMADVAAKNTSGDVTRSRCGAYVYINGQRIPLKDYKGTPPPDLNAMTCGRFIPASAAGLSGGGCATGTLSTCWCTE